jgi:hypothetical protein
MARRKRKKKARSRSHDILLVLMGSALTICALSVMYGVLIRQSMADEVIGDFRIEILNGTGEKGLAARAATAARGMGVDVFHVDNAEEPYEESVLIARKDVENLDVLGQALGCRNVVDMLKTDSLVDATLILGADYRSLNLNLDSSSSLIR